MSDASKKAQDPFTAVGLLDDAIKLRLRALSHAFMLLFGETIEMLRPKGAIDSDYIGKLFDRLDQHIMRYLEKRSTETVSSLANITITLRKIYNPTVNKPSN